MNYEGQAAVGGPIASDVAAFRLSGFYRRDGGFIDVVDEADGHVLKKYANSTDTYGGRAALGFRLGPSVTATASLLYQDQHESNLPIYFTGRGVTVTVPLERFQKVQRTPVNLDDRFLLPNLTVTADLGAVTLTSSSSYVDRRVKSHVDYSYFVQAALGLPDPFGTPLVSAGYFDRKLTAYIQEVRLASDSTGPLRWQIGGYYQYAKRDASLRVASDNLGTLIPPLAPLILPGGILFDSDQQTTSKQLAGFGELTYKATDKLELTAGVRVTSVKLGLDRSDAGLFAGGSSSISLNSSETPVTPKASIKYDVSDHAMVYVTAAKGFREGGPNHPVPTGIPACQAALAKLGLTDVPPAYGSDSLWSYEVGSKVETSDRRAGANVAAYHIDWSKIQQAISLSGGCGFQFIDNVGKAHVDGFEGEAFVRPLVGLTLDGHLGFTNAKLAQDLITGADTSGPIIAAEKGTPLALVPKWTVGGSAQYETSLGSGLSGYVRAQVDYIGSATRDLGTPSDDPRSHNRSSYTVASLRAAVSRGPWELSVFADNIFNSHPVLFETFQEFAPGSASERTTLRPRTIGTSLSTRF
jgi:outer membrane receptor protein involved in Fe transport